MSIKRRLETMERNTGGSDPLIVFFRTMIEGKDGSVESEIYSASIATGTHSGTYLKRIEGETFEQFQDRARTISIVGVPEGLAPAVQVKPMT